MFVFGFVLEEEDAATCKRQELTPDRRKVGNRERGQEGETGGNRERGDTGAPLMFGLDCSLHLSLCTQLSLHLPLYRSLHLTLYPSLHLYLSLHLSLYLFLHLTLCLCLLLVFVAVRHLRAAFFTSSRIQVGL